MQQESAQVPERHAIAPERLSALVAHANGEHAHGAVEGCAACADREALWAAVLTGDL